MIIARRHRIVIAGMAIALASSTLPAIELSKCRSMTGGHADAVEFERSTSSESAQQLSGLLVRPEGTGPYPAGVLLHRYFGIEPPDCYSSEQRRYRSWGYASLLIDSNSLPRSTRRGAPDTATGYNFIDQAEDAIAGVKYLSTLPWIDGNRIAMVGHAYGGSASLRAIVPNEGSFYTGEMINVSGVVAWHPFCPDSGETFDAASITSVASHT